MIDRRVLLMGGLGNQMFQAAYALSLKHNKIPVCLDKTFLLNNIKETSAFTPREYELDIFRNLSEEFATVGKYWWVLYPVYNYVMNKFTITEECKSHAFYRFRYLGYYQSEKYFKGINEEIRHMFSFNENNMNNRTVELATEIKNKKCLSIHVRRGDYIKSTEVNSVHGVCDLNYYKASFFELRQSEDIEKVIIFSDEPEWITDKFNFVDVDNFIVSHNKNKDSYQDMYLMSLCKHHIIANSSFSWWGAWLSSGEGKVIAPAQWYANMSNEFKDIYCSGWRVR